MNKKEIKIKCVDADPARQQQTLNNAISNAESLLSVDAERKPKIAEKLSRMLDRNLSYIGLQRSDFGFMRPIDEIIEELKQLRTPGKNIYGSEG